jgi:phenylacetate-CoA ligase
METVDSQSSHAQRAQLERIQLSKLNTLLGSILPANAFYRRKLGLDKPPVFASIQDYGRAIPFTWKREVVEDQREHPPYGSNLTYPAAAYARCHQTSGSTSAPLFWLDTQESWSHLVENWVRIFGAAAVTPRDRFFFAFSFGPFLGFWSALDAVHRMGNFCFPGGAMTSQARLQAILHNDVTVLCCTPTYARHLGEIARASEIDLRKSSVRLIVVAGEAGGSIPATRSLIESLWPGAVVFDHHGMTEVGPVSHQCPAQPGVLHLLESAYLAEIADPKTGAATLAGATGELVLTTLDRTGSPLLRYRTGDLVKARPPGVCACGSSALALEGGILGRSDDMVIVRGVNVFPSMIEDVLHTFQNIAEYRVTLDCRRAMTELSLEVETAANGFENTVLQRKLESTLESALNLRVPVQLRPPGALPRFEMKARRWIKLR